MDKFFVAEVIEFNNGDKDSPAIYSYDTEEKALAKYHKDMGAWMDNEKVSRVTITVFANNERHIKYDCHIREAKAVVPQTEAE